MTAIELPADWKWRLSPLLMAETHGRRHQYVRGQLQDIGWKTTRHHAVIDREFRRLLADPNIDCLIVKAPPRHGKLLADSTPVWTPIGWRRHGHLRVGDLVYAPDGRAVRVLGLSPKAEASWRVTFADGSSVVAHEAHEWYVYDRGRKRYTTLETQEIANALTMGKCRSGKDRSRMMLDYPKPLHGVDHELPLDPYVLGVWLGDGKQDGGSFCGAIADVAHIEAELARRGWHRSWDAVHSGTGVRYVGYRGLYPILRSLGLSREKFIPVEYLTAPLRVRRELLAGIVDTDGSVEAGGRTRVVTVSMRLARDVAHLVRTLGYRATITTQAPHMSTSGIQGRHPVHTVQWSPHDRVPQGTLPRKAIVASCVRRRNAIVSVEPCAPEQGNCIEVEGGLYLVGENLTPTHNSEYLSRWAPAWYLLANPWARVMLNSYTMSLAKFNSRWVRDTVHRLAPLWNLEGVDPMFRRADDWSLSERDGGGGMLASGVDGSQTGRGAQLILIDDYLRSAKDAVSETVRDAHWEWFKGTISTRREPGGKIVILACLAGDALVRMADGSERPIRDVRAGDAVATFDAGRLSVSVVRNHANLGHDDVFQITLASGNTVTCNARHPFLVEEAGVLKWKRLKDLTTESTIVVVREKRESGKAKSASGLKGAKNQRSVAGTVCPTTPRKNAKTGTGHLPQGITASTGSSISMASPSSSTKRCSKPRVDCAQCADSRQPRPTPDPIRPDDFVSITVTTQERSEGSCVTTAILQPATLKPEPPPLCLLDTSVFTTERVLEIRAVGREDVFDLEVEGTGSFVANGLVSHNTQWHSDDLIGRIMAHRAEIGITVRCITLQALREENGTPDPLRRAPGEALWPDRFSAEVLGKQKRLMGPYWWAAQYQGNPGSMGMSEWPAEYFENLWLGDGEWPSQGFNVSALYCDPAKGKHARKGDYYAIVFVGFMGRKLYVRSDIDRAPISVIARRMAQMAKELRPAFVGVEANAFQFLMAPHYVQACEDLGIPMDDPALIDNTLPKALRISALDPWLANRDLRFERSTSNELLIAQAKQYPFGTHDDGPDGLAGAVRLLTVSSHELAAASDPWDSRPV